MRFYRTRIFLKDYVKLPVATRKKIDRQLVNLAQDIRHPAIYAKKMTGVGDIWEARIDRQYRMTFQIQDDVIILRRAGTHEIYRKP
jgi:mRNA-degrading endonuclease RelE of RelBE toxin-antitoxin system